MWVAPAAMFLETAADSLKYADPSMLASEVKELNSFGSSRAAQICQSDVMATALRQSTVSADLTLGYLLGLQTARMILMGSPQLAIKGIKADSLL
jgi:hypothetical protein